MDQQKKLDLRILQSYNKIFFSLYKERVFEFECRQEAIRKFQNILRSNKDFKILNMRFCYYEQNEIEQLRIIRKIHDKFSYYGINWDPLYLFVSFAQEICQDGLVSFYKQIHDNEVQRLKTDLETDQDLIAVTILVGEIFKQKKVSTCLSDLCLSNHSLKKILEKWLPLVNDQFKMSIVPSQNPLMEFVTNVHTFKIQHFSTLKKLFCDIKHPIFLDDNFTTKSGHCLSYWIHIHDDNFIFYPCVVRGNHDNFIPWPPKNILEMSILDKINGTVVLISQMKLNSVYFAKPVTSYNCIYHMVKISLPIREIDQYLENDTLCINLQLS